VGKSPGSLRNSEPEFLLAGKLLKPHGLKGEIGLKVITDFPEIFLRKPYVYIGPEFRRLKIRAIRQAGKKWLISFVGLEDFNAVRNLVNMNVFFSVKQMPTLPEGEYYIHQLIGLVAFNISGERIGILSDVLQTGTNDIYVIALNENERGKEVLLPAIESVIKKIDLNAGMIVVDTDDWL